MAGLELSFGLSRPAKRLHELALLIEPQHVIRPVTVCHEDRTIWPHRHRARIESTRLLIYPRLFGIINRPYLFAVQLELDHLMLPWPRTVNIFLPALLAHFQPVN